MAFRLAVVGYGFAGKSFHGYLISLVPGLQVLGYVSRNPETREKIARENPGARVYAGLEAALADPDIDAVVIASPHDTHHPYALAALRAGKHVITDKPIALTGAESREMYAAAEAAGKHLLVFHNRRWDSDFLTLQREINAGALGEVKWIEMAWNRFGTWKSWRASAARGGGRLYDLGSHMLDQLLLLFPAPIETVYARAHFDFPDSDTPSHCQVTVRFADGKTGIIDVVSMSRYEKPRMLAMGPLGTFVSAGVDPQEAAMVQGDIDAAVLPEDRWPRVITAEGSRRVEPVAGRWRSFYEHVAEVLAGDAEPVITKHQMTRLMTVLDAAHESIRTGEAARLR